MSYLIEPYTIFQGKKKEKHWMEIADEEALFYKMIQEAQQNQQLAESTTPPVPSGWPASSQGYFNPKLSTLGFSVSPSPTGSAPYTIYLNQTSDDSVVRFCNFTWTFSDGTTSTGPTATRLVPTGSFSMSLSATRQIDGGGTTTSVNRITSSIPVPVANYTSSVQSGSVPLSVTFTNLSSIVQYTGSLAGRMTWKWDFGSASLQSVLETPPTVIYYQTGSYTVKLEATASYGHNSSLSRLYISASL